MFTDISGSAAIASLLGDEAWHKLRLAHDTCIRRELAHAHGQEIDTSGDGFFVTFARAQQALACACSIRDATRRIGLQVRIGLHLGPVEVVERDMLVGLAVHIGFLVASVAAPGEVWMTRAVRDAVASSRTVLSSCGSRALKGISGSWELFAVERQKTNSRPSAALPSNALTAARERTRSHAIQAKALVFTDVANATRLVEQLGDAAWRDVLVAHSDVVRDLTAQFGGQRVDRAGDQAFLVFDCVQAAAECSMTLATACRMHGLPMSIGLHWGEVNSTHAKPSGSALHLAVRTAASARAGEIVVTSAVRDRLNGGGYRLEDRGSRRLKGFQDPCRLYQLMTG